MQAFSILSSSNSFLSVDLTNAGSGTNEQTYGHPILTAVGDSSTGRLVYPVYLVADATTASGTSSGNATFVTPKQYNTITPNTGALQGATTAIPIVIGTGGEGFVQNQAILPLLARFGGVASATAYDVVIPACTTAADGKGGFLKIPDWAGTVSLFPQSGTSSFTARVLS